MNNKYPSHLLPKGVFSSITNAFVDNDKLYKRGGTTIFGATLGAFLLNGAFSYEPNGGTKQVIVSRNGASNAQLYKSTGGAFSAIGSANLTNSAQINFVQAANKLLGFNGAEVIDYDGTTVTKNRSGIPIGTFSFWFHNYLFVGGVSGNPNRLYWSNLGDPLTFDNANFVDINANDGDSITGFSALNDQLLVFKNYSIWSIDGWSGGTFSATTIAGQNTQSRAIGVGTPSHQSIIGFAREVYFLSFLGGTPHIRKLQQTVFGRVLDAGIQTDEIEGTMVGLNKTQLSKCAGIYDGKFIYWAVPNASSTTNNLIIVVAIQKSYPTPLGSMEPWVLFDGINAGQFFTSTISGRIKNYCIDATANGNVYLFNDTSVYSDNGTPVTMTVDTRDYMGDVAKKSKYVYMYHKYRSGSAGTLKIYARIDQAQDYSLQESVSLAGNSPGLGTFVLGTSVLGGSMIVKNRVTFAHMTGTLLGVRFKESTANYCELYDTDILGLKKGLRDD